MQLTDTFRGSEPGQWDRLILEDLDQPPVEQKTATRRGSSVEPKHELVEVNLKSLMTDGALARAEQPAFQQGGDPVNVRQEVPADFGRVARDRVVVASLGQSCVTAESVRDDVAPTFHQVFDRRDERGGGAVGIHKQLDPADAHSPDFGGDQHERFSSRAAASFPGFDATDKCLVNFHLFGELQAGGQNDRATPAVQPFPTGVVTAKAQTPLQAERASTVLLTAQVPHRLEPITDRLSTAVQQSSGSDRHPTATRLKPSKSSSGDPGLFPFALRAGKTLLTPKRSQVNQATLLVTKPLRKLESVPRKRWFKYREV